MTDQQMTPGDDPAAALLEGAPRPYMPGTLAERPTWPSIWKGLRKRCPNCGNGPLLRGYLKVRDHCPVCREPLHHHRADDGPAYLTILLVGHLMAPALHIGFVVWRPEPLILLTVLGTGATALTLFLLPRLKGAVIAFQWARRMHGFSQTETT